MSAEATMQHNVTDWDDPLPHETAAAPQAAAAAAAAPTDDWSTHSSWEGDASADTPQAAGVAAAPGPAAVSPDGADADKAKKKRNANLMIASVAIALVGVVGTGLAVKMNRSKQTADEYVAEPMLKVQPAKQSQRQAAPAAPIAVEQATPQPDVQPATDTLTAKSDLSPAPAGTIAPAPANPVAAQPVPAEALAADPASLSALKAKDSSLEAANVELKGQLAALADRVAALESKGQTAAPQSDRQSEQGPRKQNAAHMSKAKQQGKLAYDADVVRGKPGTSATAKADAEHAASWSGYHTVATYPATGKAEKAWVTNGKGLVVLTVGSELEGVKVSRLAGTTVYLADGGKISVK
ncbi:hypothetical protein K2O51_31845 (plasmid) [Cupriavidus pinatubonensis]|uniref:hypothetical protein n=1 Tax=Cupriavidus pinatubonensis TaxID=248026 RepID=UPI001C7398BE|nr:hypothetical protein [Cupriavidus pinatubonensis]QYY33620.1 hypothetical protein K2O51_31845 [Cupriavidus pinatubonensis]